MAAMAATRTLLPRANPAACPQLAKADFASSSQHVRECQRIAELGGEIDAHGAARRLPAVKVFTRSEGRCPPRARRLAASAQAAPGSAERTQPVINSFRRLFNSGRNIALQRTGASCQCTKSLRDSGAVGLVLSAIPRAEIVGSGGEALCLEDRVVVHLIQHVRDAPRLIGYNPQWHTETVPLHQ